MYQVIKMKIMNIGYTEAKYNVIGTDNGKTKLNVYFVFEHKEGY